MTADCDRQEASAAIIVMLLGGCVGAGAGIWPPPLATAEAEEGALQAFLAWLRARDGAGERYVLARFSTRSRYQTTGHAWSAFHGVRAFLAANSDLAAELAAAEYEPRCF